MYKRKASTMFRVMRGTAFSGLLAGLLLASGPASHAGIVDPARTEFVELKLPDNWYLGEVAGLEFMPSGDLVVFNRGQHPLLVFGRDGGFKRELGVGLFRVPHGLFVDTQGYIWTTDQETHQVLKFDSAGEIQLILGRRDFPGEGWFDNGYQLNLFRAPSDVATDSEGNIYVADGGNFRIVKFDSGGGLLQSWGGKGDGAGEFNFPHSLVIDEDDRIYVTDRQNARIQVFDADGGFREEWRGIGYPYELERYDANTLILTDARSGEINKVGLDGKLKEKFGQWGKRESEFGFPHGLAVDKHGNVFVGELLNWRIQKYR
ncbi:peptidyl-alpha-hydroxyglycine alpha-amidating lyase family protein [Parahaliea mediterranea]|uniref:6-bladed beta-propeller n=1 Tax=Parahaliea mediterranea TaxID=651086 RepID=A0A939IMS3_9GAMM|nr:peptidyl-alpha-hydroxyglycine alpha-amidating lyase family protein [Parahaliea mediterranea]MBN7797328.1 6-bladed beta-propeller [Parahaliea mediterranea]